MTRLDGVEVYTCKRGRVNGAPDPRRPSRQTFSCECLISEIFSWSRFGHSVRRPGQIVCPNSDRVCPNSDKIYLTVVTFRFLLLFFAYYEKRDSFLPSGSWIVLFWLPAETLSLKRLRAFRRCGAPSMPQPLVPLPLVALPSLPQPSECSVIERHCVATK